MVQRLFIVLVVQIRLAACSFIEILPEVGVGLHKDEEVTLVDVDKHLAEGQLLNADLDGPFGRLALRELL